MRPLSLLCPPSLSVSDPHVEVIGASRRLHALAMNSDSRGRLTCQRQSEEQLQALSPALILVTRCPKSTGCDTCEVLDVAARPGSRVLPARAAVYRQQQLCL